MIAPLVETEPQLAALLLLRRHLSSAPGSSGMASDPTPSVERQTDLATLAWRRRWARLSL
jgi:hypothetical protein